ncbi:MAG: AmmeMemoRadiSam system protein B [Gemmatimonadales bacterium]
MGLLGSGVRLQPPHRQRRDLPRANHRTELQIGEIRRPAVAGLFYPSEPDELRTLVEGLLAAVQATEGPATAAIVPHAGLIYSGACAAEVFKRLQLAPTVVILAPNHTGKLGISGGASTWNRGAFQTPLGDFAIAEEVVSALRDACPLVEHDPMAHAREHAIEVELPFLSLLSPDSRLVPLVLAWDDWDRCRELAEALALIVRDCSEPVSLLASSDMTHYESAASAERKDRIALEHVFKLDGEGLLNACHENDITMCGRAPCAVVLEAARLLGATHAELVDYRNSGLVTGDNERVVAYAGVVIR